MKRSIPDLAADLLRPQTRVRQVLLTMASVGTMSSIVIPQLYEKPGWIVGGIYIFSLALPLLIPVLFAWVEKTPEQLLRELGRMQDALSDLEKDRTRAEEERQAIEDGLRSYVTLYETSQAISEATDAVLLASPTDRREIAQRQIYSVLDRLIEKRTALFGMNDDRWTFSIYVYENDRLRPVATRRWSRESETWEHREWVPGEGHVGQAFRAGEELVCADSRDPEVAGFMAAKGGNVRDYDTELYVSFASLPLMIGDTDQPLGVLVATSDQPGRFVVPDGNSNAKNVVEPLRCAANVITTILYLTKDDGPWSGDARGGSDADC